MSRRIVCSAVGLLLGVALLCNFACGRAADTASAIKPAELAERIRNGTAPVVVDVRTAREYSRGHIPGAINIPHRGLAQRLAEVSGSKSAEIVVVCQKGPRAAVAEVILGKAGYTNVRGLEGHMQAWQQGPYPVE